MKPEQIMGLSIIPVTLMGAICNWMVVIAIKVNKSLNNSFSLLTGTQAVFNGTFSVLYLAYVAPMIILDNNILKNNFEHVGYFLVLCYDISIQTHVLVTVNRFCAVFLPIAYKNVFNMKWTKVTVTASIMCSVTVTITFLKILACRPTYVEEVLGFTYTDAPICLSYSWYGDLGKLTLMCVFNVVVDTITIWKVRKIRSAQGNTKFQKKEIGFLKQSFSQAIYLIIVIPLWSILPMYSNSVLTQFLLGLLFWPIIHSFDGVLTLYFNVEIRKSLAKKFKRQTNSVHNSVLVGGKSSTRIN